MNSLFHTLPIEWKTFLQLDEKDPVYEKLYTFIKDQEMTHCVFPPEKLRFTAFKLTPPDQVRVVIIGQDPYHDVGQAHGLAFSVQKKTQIPPSLRNIFVELQNNFKRPFDTSNGDLTPWAKQGVLLLNRVLTVNAHCANSHAGQGWESFTQLVIEKLNKQKKAIVFVLWGDKAQKLSHMITTPHYILQCAHPSPLSAYRGFLGSNIFNQINSHLASPIDWFQSRLLLNNQPNLF